MNRRETVRTPCLTESELGPPESVRERRTCESEVEQDPEGGRDREGSPLRSRSDETAGNSEYLIGEGGRRTARVWSVGYVGGEYTEGPRRVRRYGTGGCVWRCEPLRGPRVDGRDNHLHTDDPPP